MGTSRREFALLTELGYRRFKVVPQLKVCTQRPPKPAREGQYVPHEFVFGASGLFGEEAPGRWLTKRQALARYRLIFLRYKLWDDDRGILRHRRSGGLLQGKFRAGWYDTHAAM
jgi:hypothetical protein